jgi:hypothetical protein
MRDGGNGGNVVVGATVAGGSVAGASVVGASVVVGVVGGTVVDAVVVDGAEPPPVVDSVAVTSVDDPDDVAGSALESGPHAPPAIAANATLATRTAIRRISESYSSPTTPIRSAGSRSDFCRRPGEI